MAGVERNLIKKTTAVAVLAFLLSGCTAQKHQADVRSNDDAGKLTVGSVQKEIEVGMGGGDVAAALGSPNIVSTDENGNEVWIYDKISTDVSYSRSSTGVIVGLVFGHAAGASSSSQKTLTVIVKFDGEGKVRDVAYHSSRF